MTGNFTNPEYVYNERALPVFGGTTIIPDFASVTVDCASCGKRVNLNDARRFPPRNGEAAYPPGVFGPTPVSWTG